MNTSLDTTVMPHQRTISMKLALTIALFTWLLPMGGQAASFDCARSNHPVSDAVCSDPALSALDDELAKAYQARLRSSPDKKALKSQQLAWIQTRDSCADAPCIAEQYKVRISELSASIPAEPVPAQPITLNSSTSEAAAPPTQNSETSAEVAVDSADTSSSETLSIPEAAPPLTPSTPTPVEVDAGAVQDLNKLKKFAFWTALFIAPFAPAFILGHRVQTGRVAFANMNEMAVYFLGFLLIGFGVTFNAFMESQALKVVGYLAMVAAALCLLLLWGYQRRLSRGILGGTLMLTIKLLFLTLGLFAVLVLQMARLVFGIFTIQRLVDKKYVQSAAFGLATYKTGKVSANIAGGWEKYVNGHGIQDISDRLPDQGLGTFFRQAARGLITSN